MQTFDDWKSEEAPRYEGCDTLQDVFAVWHRYHRPDDNHALAMELYEATRPAYEREAEATMELTWVFVETLDATVDALEAMQEEVSTTDVLNAELHDRRN